MLLHTNPTKSRKILPTPVGFQNQMFVGFHFKSRKSFKPNMELKYNSIPNLI